MREVSLNEDWVAHLPASAVVPTAAHDHLRGCIDDLPEPERSVVELTLWAQMSKTDIATELGIARSHVYATWERALNMLREAL